MILMNDMSNLLWVIALIAARFYAAMSICPLFSKALMPKLVKVLMAMIFAIIFVPKFADVDIVQFGVFFRLFLVAKEILIGFTIGFIFSLPLWLVENVGNIIDLQRGEQFGAAVNKTTQNPSSSISKLLIQGFNVYLVNANGLLFFIQLIAKSLTVFPCTSIELNVYKTQALFIGIFSQYFYWLVILAIPVVFLMFLLEVSLGLFSTFIQQLNVTTLAMPLKSLISLFILIFYLGVIYHIAISKFMTDIYHEIITL